jgi:putative FmdB family regulatory protein
MPIYEYVCRDCGHADDEFQKIVSDPLEVCPVCGHSSYQKQVSVPHSDLIDFHTPILMHSIGCVSTDQIRDMQKAGVEISDDPNDPEYGIPKAVNRKMKLTALKVAGYVERK